MRAADVMTPQRELVLAAVRNEPGVSLRDLSRRVMAKESTIEHHARRLEKAGMIVREREGRVLAHCAVGDATLSRKRRRERLARDVADALRVALPRAESVEARDDLVLVRLSSGERFVLANHEAATRAVIA